MERSTVIGKPEMQNAKRERQNSRGFSLLELMIAMFILVILLSVALPTYQYTVQHAKETVLKENIRHIENAIDQYAADKGKLPQSIQELVEAKYLREVPVDPITEKAEWSEIQGEDGFSSEGGQGLVEVKSLAEGEDSTGKRYDEY
ncbi:MAG TPA: prepilin-type N-terminal cleavage/methylation domain-containing protein [Pyrinomonadaceae bacterium]|nr:prepilin-type N-terminal cleavage/methylation domain-containing protein [Pyrinomonadaceae bacterium]